MRKSDDTISRQAAIDAVNSETVSTNPEQYKSSEKFIKFMDDSDTSSFGKWQWANGFNTALVATRIHLEKLPSVQPEIIRCKDCKYAKWDDERGEYICNGRAVWENHYCGYAKRKGEDDETD
jgi:hypothetical protein